MIHKMSPAFRVLREGRFKTLEEMRRCNLVIFLRMTIVLALVYAFYAAIAYSFGQLDRRGLYIPWAASLIAFVGCHALLIIRHRHNLSAILYLAVILTGIFVGESDYSGFYLGASVIYFAIPVVLAPAILPPYTALVLWLFLSAISVIVGLIQGQGAQVNVFALVSLLFVALGAYIVGARTEGLVRKVMAEKAVLNQALDVVIEYEQNVTTLYREHEANGPGGVISETIVGRTRPRANT